MTGIPISSPARRCSSRCGLPRRLRPGLARPRRPAAAARLGAAPVCNASGAPLSSCRMPATRRAGGHVRSARSTSRASCRCGSATGTTCSTCWCGGVSARQGGAQRAALRRAAEQFAARARTGAPSQDALTLFDEGGVIVASCDERSARDAAGVPLEGALLAAPGRGPAADAVHLFGHALYEKALRPFTGIAAAASCETERDAAAGAARRSSSPATSGIASPVSRSGRALRLRASSRRARPGRAGVVRRQRERGYYDNLDYFRPGRSGEVGSVRDGVNRLHCRLRAGVRRDAVLAGGLARVHGLVGLVEHRLEGPRRERDSTRCRC